MDGEDDVDQSENMFLELISSMKSNKQILRKILKSEEVKVNGNDEIQPKKLKIDNSSLDMVGSTEKNPSVAINKDADIGDEEEGEDEDEDLGCNNEDSNDDVDDDGDTDDADDDLDIDYSESNESDDDDVSQKDFTTSAVDPFKIHFEQVLKEETVDAIIKSKYEIGERNVLNNITVCEESILPGHIISQLGGFLVDLKKHDDEKELFREAVMKDSLVSNWKHLEKSKKVWSNNVHNSLFRSVVSYKDVFHLSATYEYLDKIRHLYVLHVVNHVLKSGTRVLKNNAKLFQAQKSNKEIEELRDQGLTRPKVLILVPFKNFCLEIVRDIMKLLFSPGSKAQIMQKKRFMQEFSPDPNEKESKMERPDDFKAMFRGNIDDCFRIGLSISKNTLKLYSEFYSADIIIASPLGLRTIIGSEGEKQDFDFLSSIEILILDQADAFLMQNWEHVTHIFEHLNLIPKQSHDTDFSRVRMSSVNGWSKYYRQTLLFSSLQSPEINGIFNKYCLNYNGKIRYLHNNPNGSITQIVLQIPQVYQRINSSSFIEDPDKRFDYFTRTVLPNFKNDLYKGTAIFVPSYYDFVRLRNYFKKEHLSFLQISEYSKRSNISRSRSMFLERRKHFLIFTERFQFFYRYRLKGIRHIIFYQLPHFPNFYSEVLNLMERSSSASCTVLYSRFDGFKLEAVVGSARCKQMVLSPKDTHMIVTGD